MAVERRLTEIVGPVGGKLHTARSRNDQVATDLALLVRSHSARAIALLEALMSTLVELAEAHKRLAGARLHAPPARPARLPRPPPARLLLDVLPRRAPLLPGRGVDQRHARRLGRAGRRSTGTSTARGSPPISASSARTRTRSTPSPTATSRSTTSTRPRSARCTSRGSARRSCSGRARSSASASPPTRSPRARASCPRRRTPTPRSCCAARRRGSPPRWRACSGTMHGLPLAYSKDMQEDKEPLFDAIDNLELCLEAATPMLAGLSFNRERLAEAAGDEMLAATDLADVLVARGSRSARPTAWSPAWSGPPSTPASSSRSWTTPSSTASPRRRASGCATRCARAARSRRRSPPAAPRRRGSPSSSSWPARAWPTCAG